MFLSAFIFILKKKHPCHTKLWCAFRCLISRPQKSNSEISKSNSREITSFSNTLLRYFRGSRSSQCFILSTSPHYSLPSKFVLPIVSTAFKVSVFTLILNLFQNCIVNIFQVHHLTKKCSYINILKLF